MIKSITEKRKSLISLFILACVLAFVLSAFFAFSSFAQNNDGPLKNQTFEADGRNGVMYRASSDTTFTLLENASGDFDIEMRAVPDQIGTTNFDRLTVLLKDVNTNFGVEIALYKNESTSKDGKPTISYRYAIKMTHPEKAISIKREVWGVDTKLDGTGNVTRFTFDTDTYELCYYKNNNRVVAFDLDDPVYLARLGTRTALNGFENYSVQISVSGISQDKQAKVIVYSINGQQFSGAEYTNTAGAVLAVKPALSNGVLGEEYKLDFSSLCTADVLDGLKDGFNGTVKAVSPSGVETFLADGKFIPSEVGTYKLSFEAKDSAGLVGQAKTYEIYVYGYHPDTFIDLAYPVADVSLGKGATLNIPKATAKSELTLFGKNPSVSLKLVKDSSEIKFFDASVYNQYVFNDLGSFSLVYSVTDALGKEFSLSNTITVSDGLPVINVTSNFNEVVMLNEKVVIPSASCSNGKTVSSVTYYPDGRSLSSSCIKADVYGLYKVVYSVEGYSLARYFNVLTTADSLWQNVKGTLIEGNVNAPEYSAADINGVQITATRENATVQYLNAIDLTDNTKTDKLIEFLITPDTNGVAEFNNLQITLTDVNDPTKYIKINFDKDNYGDLYVVRPNVKTDKNANFYNYGILGGQQSIKGSYNGMFERNGVIYPANTISIHFDYENLTIYASIKNDGEVYSKVAKLDDTELVGQGNEWDGFTTGKAYLSFTFQKVVSSQAHLMVFNVDGQSMSGEKVVDVTPPFIEIDFKGNEEGELPCAVVNKDYPLFSATATDLVYGNLGVPQVKVYRLIDGKKVKVYNYDYDSFKPTEVGTYVIEYSATDKDGNVAIKDVFVEATSSVDELTYDFGAITSSTVIGSYIDLPDGSANGGSGKKTVLRKVVVGDREIEVVEGQFFADVVGDYSVSVTVKDYIGNEKVFTHVIRINPNDKPVFVDATVPKAVMVNRKVDFSNVKAYEYLNNERKDVPVTVLVNSVAKETLSGWAFAEAGVYTVEFKAEGTTGVNTAKYTVTALKATENQALYLKDFFLLNNLEVSSGETSLIFTASGSNAGFTFANSVSAVEFGMSISVPKENNAMDGIRVRLTDVIDPNKELVFEILKGDQTSNTSIFNVLGGESKMMVGSFFGTTAYPFMIKYDNSTFEVKDYQGNLLSIIDKVNGKTWKGFTSDRVYLDVEIINGEVGSSISLIDINNQSFSGTTKKDRIAPQIFYSSLNKVMNHGDTLVLKPAKAFDVLGTVESFTLTVTAPSGTKVLSKVDATKEYSLTINEFGEYYVKYTAVDDSDKEVTRTAVINVKNKQAPTITIIEDVVKTAKLDKTVKLPTASVSGSSENISLFVTVIKPNGSMTVLEEMKFTCDVKGKYKVVYFAIDSYGNSAEQTFYIEVE